MTKDDDSWTKKQALATFLDCETEDLEWTCMMASIMTVPEHGNADYLVLTSAEADKACRAYILDSLWAFNADFIAAHSRTLLSRDAIAALAEMQNRLCESANELVKALIDDLDRFIADAIEADGRGHFLSSYDGEEGEQGQYYIYRVG